MSIFNQNLKSPLEVIVEWVRNSSVPPLTLSISALMLNKDDVINRLEDFVFYGTPNKGNDIISSDKSVTCDALNFEKGFGTENSYKMNLELGRVSANVDRINIVVSINTKGDNTQLPAFDSLTKATFSIKDAAGLTFTTDLNKTGESSCRCISVGLVRRYAQFWRFEEEMELKLGGLELVYNEYMSDSIKKNYPFSKIGDLSLIENRYKKTTKTTNISKDGSKSIIEKTVEMITTQLGKIAGTIEPQKPWKVAIPINPMLGGNSAGVNSNKEYKESGHREGKKWSALIPQQHKTENNGLETKDSMQKGGEDKPWKSQIPHSPNDSGTCEGASTPIEDTNYSSAKPKKNQIVSRTAGSSNKNENKPWSNIIPNKK